MLGSEMPSFSRSSLLLAPPPLPFPLSHLYRRVTSDGISLTHHLKTYQARCWLVSLLQAVALTVTVNISTSAGCLRLTFEPGKGNEYDATDAISLCLSGSHAAGRRNHCGAMLTGCIAIGGLARNESLASVGAGEVKGGCLEADMSCCEVADSDVSCFLYMQPGCTAMALQ